MSLADELRAALARDTRPDGEIADAAGMHRVSLNRFKNGQRELGVDAAERLAAVLGLRVELKKPRRKK